MSDFISKTVCFRHVGANELVLNGDLIHQQHPSEDRKYEVTYAPSTEGKKALLEDFYYAHLSGDKQPRGVTRNIYFGE